MSKGSRPRPYSVSLDTYRDNYDAIFGKKKKTEEEKFDESVVMKNEYYDQEDNMQVRVQEDESKIGSCGCGRSPTGKCIGWHGLTEEEFRVKLAEHQAKENSK